MEAYFTRSPISYARSPVIKIFESFGRFSKSTSHIQLTSRPSGILSLRISKMFPFLFKSLIASIDWLNPAGFFERSIIISLFLYFKTSCLPKAGLKSERASFIFSIGTSKALFATSAAAFVLYILYFPNKECGRLGKVSVSGFVRPHPGHMNFPRCEYEVLEYFNFVWQSGQYVKSLSTPGFSLFIS